MKAVLTTTKTNKQKLQLCAPDNADHLEIKMMMAVKAGSEAPPTRNPAISPASNEKGRRCRSHIRTRVLLTSSALDRRGLSAIWLLGWRRGVAVAVVAGRERWWVKRRLRLRLSSRLRSNRGLWRTAEVGGRFREARRGRSGGVLVGILLGGCESIMFACLILLACLRCSVRSSTSTCICKS